MKYYKIFDEEDKVVNITQAKIRPNFFNNNWKVEEITKEEALDYL